jgi:addiction module RelE/StbE family toxin
MKKSLGNKQYAIEFKKSVIEVDLVELSKSTHELIQRAIEERLMVDPISFGKPLRYNFKGYRRLRVSTYRIIYRIDEKNHKVIITDINHRKDAYDE